MLAGNRRPSVTLVTVCIIIAMALVAPHMVRAYSVELLNIFLVNVILVCSYRLIVTTGDWGLSHVVMMGVGGYAAALAAKHLGLPVYLTLPLAGATAGCVAGIISIPLLRTRGFGFFIASFAMAELLRLAWVKMEVPFGGVRGIINVPMGSVFGHNLFHPVAYYYFALAVTSLCVFVMFQLDRSRIGMTWKALFADSDLAESTGIDVQYYRRVAYIIGGAFAGVAGALLAHRMGAIDPKNFDLTTMIYLVIWVVVGGTGTFWGPILGLVTITFFFEWTRPLLEWRPLIFGGILIMFLVLLPDGLDRLLGKLGGRIFGKKGA
jgi:branched-chain amino acid transport system permease protein